ncbi:MAG: hypothetical protein ACTSWR_11910 [Candidatus Helarchaeota archaeon]
MDPEQEICPNCGEPITRIVFKHNNKIIKEILVCNCDIKDRE